MHKHRSWVQKQHTSRKTGEGNSEIILYYGHAPPHLLLFVQQVRDMIMTGVRSNRPPAIPTETRPVDALTLAHLTGTMELLEKYIEIIRCRYIGIGQVQGSELESRYLISLLFRPLRRHDRVWTQFLDLLDIVFDSGTVFLWLFLVDELDEESVLVETQLLKHDL